MLNSQVMLGIWVDSFDDHGNWMKLRILWGFLTMALQSHEIDDPSVKSSVHEKITDLIFSV